MCHQLLRQLGFWALLVSCHKPRVIKVWPKVVLYCSGNFFFLLCRTVTYFCWFSLQWDRHETEVPTFLWEAQITCSLGSHQCVWEDTLACAPHGEAALCPQDAAPHSAETADQTQVLSLSLRMAAAVVQLQQGPVSGLLVTQLVRRQLGSFAASCTHSVWGFQVIGSMWKALGTEGHCLEYRW